MADLLDVTELSWSSLVEEANERRKELKELAKAAVRDETAIKAAKAAFIAADAEVAKREATNKTTGGASASKTESKPAANEETERLKAEKTLETQQLKNMVNIITTDVPKFTSAVCVHGWINTIQAYYNLYVKNSGKNKAVFEGHFVQTTLSKIQPDYLNAMTNGDTEIKTFDAMKKYLKENHSSKLSIYQVLDTVWDMQKMDVESLRDFGHRLDDKAVEAESIIKAVFDNTIRSQDPSKSLTKTSVFKLVSGQVFLQFLKINQCNVYNHIVNDLDATWSAAEIALKAMSYSDRLKTEDEEHQSKRAVFHSKKKGEEICKYFLTGGCKYGEKCQYKHDDGLRKYLDETLYKNGSSDKKESKKSHQTKNVHVEDETSDESSSSDDEPQYGHHVEVVALPPKHLKFR